MMGYRKWFRRLDSHLRFQLNIHISQAVLGLEDSDVVSGTRVS
jgi:hypothetical protein